MSLARVSYGRGFGFVNVLARKQNGRDWCIQIAWHKLSNLVEVGFVQCLVAGSDSPSCWVLGLGDGDWLFWELPLNSVSNLVGF